jgi:hypothetical protein
VSVTELSLSRYRRDLWYLRGLYVHPRLRNRNTRWRMKRERVRARQPEDDVEIKPHREVVVFGTVDVCDEWWPWPGAINKATA